MAVATSLLLTKEFPKTQKKIHDETWPDGAWKKLLP